MLWWLLVLLLLFWVGGFAILNVGEVIHFLLVVALIVLVVQLFTGRRASL